MRLPDIDETFRKEENRIDMYVNSDIDMADLKEDYHIEESN